MQSMQKPVQLTTFCVKSKEKYKSSFFKKNAIVYVLFFFFLIEEFYYMEKIHKKEII